MSSRLEGVRVLLVDDEPELIKIFQIHLQFDGAVVSGALDGDQALAILRKQPIDIVVTDIRMPHCDGRELVQKIKQMELPTQVVCLSAFSDYSEQEVLAWGADAYYQKPLQTNALISRLVELRQSRK